MAEANKLSKREEIDNTDKWRLEDLFASNEEWEDEFKSLQSGVDQLLRHSGKLGKSPQDLAECLEAVSENSKRMERLYVFAHMRRDEDTNVALYQQMSDRVESLGVQISSATSFITPEILEIPKEKLDSFAKDERRLDVYDHYLDDINRSREHILSKPEEKLLAMSGEIASAARNIYTMLNNADTKFPSVVDEDGVETEITHGRYTSLMESRNRELRKDTFEKFYSTYQGQKNTWASLLNASVKADIFYANARKFDGALEAALMDDNVPASVYDGLIDTIHKGFPSLHRYIGMKKKALNLSEMHMYDLYAPITDSPKQNIPYDRAIGMVREGMQPLGKTYCDALEKSFSEAWIDRYENVGKMSGAYCWGAFGTHPYVLLNYQGNINHVFTIAHELGHAMHSYFSDGAQPYPKAQYAIFNAEVASTVNELLLSHYLIQTEKDDAVRASLLNHYLEQFRTTVFRQVMFSEFERITHNMVQNGEPLTSESIVKVYTKLNSDYHGPSMVLDSHIGMEWARVSHFFRAFYVYKYATGFSSAVAIAMDIITKKNGAAESYMDFLKSGGSGYPLDLLKITGVDLNKPDTVNACIKAFDEGLESMEKILGV